MADVTLTDIFGEQHETTYTEGLVDSSSEQKFDEKLQELEQVWNDCDLPYCPESGPRFYRLLPTSVKS